jgi:DNA-binding beta-propeller fold protein YncE
MAGMTADLREARVADGASPVRVEFRPSVALKEKLSRLGRTEDVRFSPDNRLLAIAGYTRQVCLFIRFAIEVGPAGPIVTADDFMEVTSDGINQVHGLDFIDDRTLAVANRDNRVDIIRLPAGEPGGRQYHAPVLRHLKGSPLCRIRTPGSLAVGRMPFGQVALFVCNNYTHRVTRHVVAPSLGYLCWRNQVLLQRQLDIPDGIAISATGRWLAVSSHRTNDVKLYDASAPLGADVEPVGTLRQAGCPHGLRFAMDDQRIIVADAGGPFLNVYERGESWAGARDPARTVTVLDNETFLRGHTNPQEGGPKGLDIDKTGTILATTCEEDQLSFFTLGSVLGNA